MGSCLVSFFSILYTILVVEIFKLYVLNSHHFILSFYDVNAESLKGYVRYQGCCIDFSYRISERRILVHKEHPVNEIIQRNIFQFDKVVRSAIKGKLKPGLEVSCVFIEDFKFLKEEDYNKIIRVDRTNGDIKIDVLTSGKSGIPNLYADGSYTNKGMKSGYGGVIVMPDGIRDVYSQSFYNGSSNLMELMAVIEGLLKLKAESVIQVNTDSRFVIRGVVQWIHFWKLNNWQTAFGKDVKFKEYWQKIDHLCDGKITEFCWVKGHSGHEEQSFCHNLARKSARRFFGPLPSKPL